MANRDVEQLIDLELGRQYTLECDSGKFMFAVAAISDGIARCRFYVLQNNEPHDIFDATAQENALIVYFMGWVPTVQGLRDGLYPMRDEAFKPQHILHLVGYVEDELQVEHLGPNCVIREVDFEALLA